MRRRVEAEGVTIEYTLIQAPRKTVLIQALEGDATRVYAPKGARLRDIDRLVRENARMILDAREALRPAPLKDGECVRVEGVARRLRLEKGAPEVRLTEGELIITAPDTEDSDALRTLARAFLSERALGRIRERIAHYLPLTGGEINRVTVRAQKSRWGSCSAKNNLNFNWRLILAPPECLDYVVIHELCHLKEFNHSPRFWALVEKQMPDFRTWKDYLRRNGQGLTL